VAGATIAFHRARGTFTDKIALYLALTSFQRSVLVSGGFPAERIRVLSNFLEPDPGQGTGPRAGILYVGRLSEEKGISPLLRAAELEPGLVRVVGDGPLTPLVEAAAASGVVGYAGYQAGSAVQAGLGRALALVLPSIWFEGFPLVIAEAYAAGTPIIASRIGSLAELIEDGVTGLLVQPNEPRDLAGRIRWASDHPEEMRRLGVNARRAYEARFRGPTHLAGLLEAYAWAGDGRS
jgi:glycosyltransferase involved in cell wall biosynthesis